MENFVTLLSELSSIIGVPAVLCLAWAAFIIRDHSKRITALEQARIADATMLDSKFDQLFNRVNDVAIDVAYLKGQKDKDK